MLDEFYRSLDDVMRSGNMERAEEFLIEQAAMLENEGLTPQLATVYSEVGSFYRGIDNFSDAIEYYNKSLSVFASLGMENSIQYSMILINQASIMRLVGKPLDAISIYLESKRLLEEAALDSMYLYITVANSLSIAYNQVKEYDSAIEMGNIALNKIRKNHEADEHEAATTLNNIANAYLGNGNIDSAYSSAGESLALFEAMPYENIHHAAALATFGSICYRKGEFAKAAEAFEKSLPLTKRFFGINTDYVAACFNLYLTYIALEENNKASQCLDEAFTKAKNLLGESHPYTQRFRKAIEAEAAH